MISSEYYERLAQVESAGDPNAKNPKSSASGLFQFTSSTAEQYGLKDPKDPIEARKAVEKFTTDNAKVLEKHLGRPPTEGELYLAHQQGAKGATELLSNPDKKAIEVLGVDQVLNNGGDENITAKDFADKWAGKFGIDAAVKPEVATQEPPIEQAPVKIGKTIILPDGKKIQLTGEETPEVLGKIKRKIFENYAGSVKIDRKSGAPASVRAVVGGVNKPDDRLATLQKYYPDAFPYGGDNFIYTNPQTKKLTLYNPKGWDWGDTASVAREGSQLAGSGIGAIAGAATGATVSIPTLGSSVPIGAVVGSGIGAGIATSAFDAISSMLGLTVDTRSPAYMALEKTAEVTTFAAGEGVGRLAGTELKVVGKKIASKAKNILGGGTNASKNLLKQFDSFGIDPSASLVAKNQGMARLEAGLQSKATSAEIMAKQADDIVTKTHKAVNTAINKIGKPRSTQGAGEVISEAAIGATKRFEGKSSKLYDDAFNAIGESTFVKLEAVQSLRIELVNKIAQAPQSLGKKYSGVLKEIDVMLADAGEEGIQFGGLRSVRTSIREDLKKAALATTSGTDDAMRERLYSALTLDMSKAAQEAGSDAATKLSKADKFYADFMQTTAKTLDKIDRFDADERALKFVLSYSRDGGTTLARLRSQFTVEEWDTVAATVVNKLGEPNPGLGGEFSISNFVTNWNKLAPEAKNALLGGPRYQKAKIALDSLSGLMSKIKEVRRLENASNTASAIQSTLFISTVLGGGVIGGLSSGDAGGAVKGAGLGLLAGLSPAASAKLITNPKFISWLAEPVEMAVKNKAFSIVAQIAKLEVLAKEQPEIKDEIYQFMNTLKEETNDKK